MTADSSTIIHRRLADELGVRVAQVEATVRLFDEGSTVPFVARYRKEATGGLDDRQLRKLDERLGYLRELEERRSAVLAAIDEQGKLTTELRAAIEAADTKTRLEDLYLPYRKKRRTKAQVAREQGLEPLIRGLLEDPGRSPEEFAVGFVDPAKEIPDVAAALEGARQILMEDMAEDPDLAARLRAHVLKRAEIRSEVADRLVAEGDGARFRDWFDHAEPLAGVPSHRALAFLRGRKAGALRLRLRLDPEDADLGADSTGTCAALLMERFGIRDQGRAADAFLIDAAQQAWRVKVSLRIETDLMADLRARAEEEAIEVFARNLHDLLLAAPAGPKRILGLDPGLRTGVKAAVVDETGRVLETTTIYPAPPRSDVEGSLATLRDLVERHAVSMISVGNGTGSRETDRCVQQLVRSMPERGLTKILTSEAGASVYSASELASEELPDLDVSLRGAVSIARRVQDPLAELVKIEPRSIGVGQYQHDVDQGRLARQLGAVVEDCVNAVGVDVNTASPALLGHVAGLTPTLARNIVAWRDANGPFRRREQLLAVPRLGPKAYEQAAGFLRIRDGDEPLDASAVHPEAYDVVRRIEARTGRTVAELIGQSEFLRGLAAADFVDDRFGEPTVQDILVELEKPGRDPRPEWRSAAFQDGVEEIADLKPGMVLEGAVTNVTNFGAFVDLGVHQDGLVHVSRLSERFVEDPREIVKAGDIVKVKVLEVDAARKRIALTMRMADEPGQDRRGGRPDAADGTDGARRGGRSNGRGGRRRANGDARGAPLPKGPVETGPEVKNAFARAFDKLREQERRG